MTKYKKIVLGIDQSYKNTGITICADGKIKKITSLQLDKMKTNSEKREALRNKLDEIVLKFKDRSKEFVFICERIRLSSRGFINIDYIKSIGALNATIVDVAQKYDIKVYSVDTRSWKAQVVGTSKPKKNDMGVSDEKWPTIEFLIKKGFEDQLLLEASNRVKKGFFIRNGKRFKYNDDAADSACISLYGFLDKANQKLKEEH